MTAEKESNQKQDALRGFMYQAFKHGLEFEYLETKGEPNIQNMKDKNLPFSEWFNKYFKIPITEDVLLEKGWTRAGFTCVTNEFGIRTSDGKFKNRILVDNDEFLHIDTNTKIKYTHELPRFLDDKN